MSHNKNYCNNTPAVLNPTFNTASIENQMIYIMNTLTKSNVDHWTEYVRSNYNIDDILPKIIVKGIAVSGSTAIIHHIADFIHRLYGSNYRITELMFDFDIKHKSLSETRKFWYMFWALYFNETITYIETLRMYQHMLNNCYNISQKVECVKSFVYTHLYISGNHIDDELQFRRMQLEMYSLGILYYETVVENVLHYQLYDALDFIYKERFADYRESHDVQ